VIPPPPGQHPFDAEVEKTGRGRTAARSIYNTRHTFITHALLDSWTTHEVARYCGTSPRMTDEHYAGIIKSWLDEKITRIDATARLGTVPKGVSASEEN
jgi:hypothetical protein